MENIIILKLKVRKYPLKSGKANYFADLDIYGLKLTATGLTVKEAIDNVLKVSNGMRVKL